ncbi:hypothetical protein [Actinomadura yumaensis]|uniref:DNA-binding phage zinc finger domain-containing protein n=1 Tax=Actinomadura yumaensis TaxID=111807 RepID=A0ABW2CNV2_9ACTN
MTPGDTWGRGTPPNAVYRQARAPFTDEARALALTVPCPVESCGARPTEPCTTASGAELVRSPAHPSRLAAARQAQENQHVPRP